MNSEIFILALCSVLEKKLEQNNYTHILKNRCNLFRYELSKVVGNVFRRKEVSYNPFAASSLMKSENDIQFVENMFNGISFVEGMPTEHGVKCIVTNDIDDFSKYKLVTYDKQYSQYKSNDVHNLVYNDVAFKYYWQIPEFTLND